MSLPTVLLASNSPRRRELLGLTGWPFTVQPADIDETPLPGELPPDYTVRLAQGKARAAGALAQPGALVLGADTTVADGVTILGKPKDTAEAASMLRRLRGHVHTVYTAVALYDAAGDILAVDLCATAVPMRDYTELEIDRYVASGDPLDKAGAYAIQHGEFHPVDDLRGCYASVMGLPLCHLERTMRKFGYSPLNPLAVPRACQAALNYNCPAYAAILSGENAG
jgi:septum formation protein